MKRIKDGKDRKGCGTYRSRVVSALLVTLMLAVLFLSSSTAVTVKASGLVDDTVDGVNLYSKYSIFNYQLDFYVDTSWGWLPWNWLDTLGDVLARALYAFTNVIWQLGTMLSSFTGYVVQEAYELDFVGDMADTIGKNMQTLAGISERGVARNGFYPGFLRLTILVVGIYVAYVGLVKREMSKAISAVINMLVIFVITAGIIAYAPTLVKNVNEFSSDVGTAALELGTELTMPGNDEMGADAVDKIRNTLFSIQIYKPWLLLQFGTSDEAEIGTERIESILGVEPLANWGEDRTAAVKADIETYENANLTVTNVMNRFGMVLFIFIINLIISIFVFLMSGMMILTQSMFIMYTMFLVVSFVLSMFPTYNGLVKKSVMKVFNIIMMRAGLTLVVTVAFSISAMVYSMSEEYTFSMIGFLQIVVFGGIYLKLNDILSMISLQDADSDGKRRGNLLRSAGRYMVMRNLFGKYRRRSARSQTGNSTGTIASERKWGDTISRPISEKERKEMDTRYASWYDPGSRIRPDDSVPRFENHDGTRMDGENGFAMKEGKVNAGPRRSRQESVREDTEQGSARGQDPENGATREAGMQGAAGAVQRERREPDKRTSGSVSGEKTANEENDGPVNGKASRRRRRQRSTYNAQRTAETEKKSETLETAQAYKGRKSVWWSVKSNDAGKQELVSGPASESHRSENGALEPDKRESLAPGKVRRTAGQGAQGTKEQVAPRPEHTGNRTRDTGREQKQGQAEVSSDHGVPEHRNMQEERRDSLAGGAQSVVHERAPREVREERMSGGGRAPEWISERTSDEGRMPEQISERASGEERVSRETDGNLSGSGHISGQVKEKEITESRGMKQEERRTERRTEQKQVTAEEKEVTEDKTGGR